MKWLFSIPLLLLLMARPVCAQVGLVWENAEGNYFGMVIRDKELIPVPRIILVPYEPPAPPDETIGGYARWLAKQIKGPTAAQELAQLHANVTMVIGEIEALQDPTRHDLTIATATQIPDPLGKAPSISSASFTNAYPRTPLTPDTRTTPRPNSDTVFTRGTNLRPR